MRAGIVFVAGLLLSACAPSGFTVYATPAAVPAINSFFEFLPSAHGKVVSTSDPAKSLSGSGAGTVGVALSADLTCGECYKLTGSGGRYTVHAGGTLGLQYGLAELLEAFNFRFFHPWATKAPSSLVLPDNSASIGPTFTPQMELRGLHLHTLHPIESHFAFWQTSSADLEDARRIDDWIIKNRGNYVEWSALNNIVEPGPTQDGWHTHTQQIIADAHQRGMKVGLGFEMFGTANLQLSYDILDNEDPTDITDIDARLHLILDGLPFDKLDISFGEFAGSDPDVFIQSLDNIYTELQKIAPGTELDATIHMDNTPTLQINYMGQTLPYYFLVQFANPAIVPWIHSVMYFDLFQPADGAYDYSNFSLHLGYLQSRLQAGKPVGYYPESAYWITFDDSVPTYLPVYMRSRWLDMSQIQANAKQGGYSLLNQHVEFSSGFEWGYWQNDYATLRMNFGLPASWEDEVDEMFSPYGSAGTALAVQVYALGELQSQALIEQALAPYLASRDELTDLGEEEGTISQPTRPSFATVAALQGSDLTQFQQTVLAPLASLETQTAQIQANVAALHLDASDPWLGETMDGIDVDVARTQFIQALYEAAATFAAQGNDGGWLAKADTALAAGQTVVARRDAHLHYPTPSLLLDTTSNATIYQYGYLYYAGSLCYWGREQIQAQNAVLGQSVAVPDCSLQ